MKIQSRNILIVDRNRKDLMHVAQVLKRFDHTVHLITRGEKALELKESKSFDLYVVNDDLEDMEGVEFLRSLDRQDRGRVIYLAGPRGINEFFEVTSSGVYEFVNKPVDPVELAVIVCDYFVVQVNSCLVH